MPGRSPVYLSSFESGYDPPALRQLVLVEDWNRFALPANPTSILSLDFMIGVLNLNNALFLEIQDQDSGAGGFQTLLPHGLIENAERWQLAIAQPVGPTVKRSSILARVVFIEH
jgi:hypothetical protein